MSAESGRGPGSITISRPVQVRARVTEGLKKQLAAEVQEALRRTEVELQQLEFQLKKAAAEAEKVGPQQAQALRQHLESERQKRADRKSALIEKLRDIARLEPGSEIVQGAIEGLAVVRIGDRWEDVVQAAIVLEDGVVVDIRCKRAGQAEN